MVFVLLPIIVSLMSTAAIDAFSNKSAPPVSASTTLNRHNAQQQQPQPHEPSHSLSSRSVGVGYQSAGSVRSTRRSKSALACSPAQVLTDASYVVMDPNKFFPDVLGTTFLPHHGVHPEEMAVQLFLLSVSMKPIIRSVQLYQCITSAKGDCAEECA
eukprot:CAMPEP_0171046256 /NCGR_PEP_ID=MMETSP0736-20130129/49382_1 /TAXON_ID=186038 /ORGANISM="Fragilariopsis kerguelensis, Strain L26-C5" /LENGTH=156 /DNA_ID=CAMNT_0011497173 /DNA_START=93 /DNA_END=559 /DNA_ORIENTATION=-